MKSAVIGCSASRVRSVGGARLPPVKVSAVLDLSFSATWKSHTYDTPRAMNEISKVLSGTSSPVQQHAGARSPELNARILKTSPQAIAAWFTEAPAN